MGFDSSIKGPKCPEEKIFRVKINPPVKFQPIFINLSCSGEYEYVAQVENYPANQVDYFWRDPSGNLVESGPKMISSINGTFTLEVQPKGSLPCLTSTSSFELPVPVLSVDTKIIASTLCPDQPNATLQVDTSIDQVNTIEWWFIDFNKNRNQLTSEVNKTNILVSLKGTYEVIAKNEFNCILGKDQVLVLRSTDEVQPKLKETYPVCPNYGIGCGLNPGQFSTYEWYNEGALIWTNPTFKPLQIGNYELFVESAEGCIYQTSFSTFEECELKVRLPNALQITNPDKQFLVYTNYLVDELEIWIYNKWGSLIFHCKNTDLINEESTCIWDGYYNGVPLPNGTYAYRTYFVNLEKGIRKEQFGSILVVD